MLPSFILMDHRTLIIYKSAKYWKKQYFLMYWIWIFSTIVMVGLVMNFVAIVDNGGKMPVANVSVSSTYYDSHFSFSDPSEIKHSYLADIYRVNGYVYSMGDFVMTIGLLGMVILSIIIYLFERRFKRTFSESYIKGGLFDIA